MTRRVTPPLGNGSPGRRRDRHAWLLGLAALIALAWCAGFVWFVHIAQSRPDLPAQADAIVTLTGGAGRVEAGLRLLADGRAPRLLVSGVGGTAEFAAFARRAGADQTLASRVTLGRTAGSTHGNAAETAEWAQAYGARSLIVVTSAYHMPRALAELSRALPRATLYPAPVVVAWTPGTRLARLRLLAEEYTKWLAVLLGVSDLAPHSADRIATAAPHEPSRTVPRLGG